MAFDKSAFIYLELNFFCLLKEPFIAIGSFIKTLFLIFNWRNNLSRVIWLHNSNEWWQSRRHRLEEKINIWSRPHWATDLATNPPPHVPSLSVGVRQGDTSSSSVQFSATLIWPRSSSEVMTRATKTYIFQVYNAEPQKKVLLKIY